MTSLQTTPYGERRYPGLRRYSKKQNRPNQPEDDPGDERFDNGSTCDLDLAPSSHITRSRAYDEDESIQSFFPSERDWGDSLSTSHQQGLGESNMTNSTKRDLTCNASYKRRTLEYDDEPAYDYSRRGSDICHSNHTLSTAVSSISGDSQMNLIAASRANFAQRRSKIHSRYDTDLGESAHASRPDFSSSARRSDSGRFSSTSSISGCSVGSRSAPARRTPLPREPSLYRRESSHSEGSQRRSFSYKRTQSDESALRRRQQQSHCMPPNTVDIVLSQCSLHQPRQAPPSSAAPAVTMVDIAPGVQEPLRGTEETYKAVAKDFYSNVSCFGCTKELCCIADVSYVICPECKVISPLGDDTPFEGRKIHRSGLGLGFTYDALFQIQVEIMQKGSH